MRYSTYLPLHLFLLLFFMFISFNFLRDWMRAEVESLTSQYSFCLLCFLIKPTLHCHVFFIFRCDSTKDSQTDGQSSYADTDSYFETLEKCHRKLLKSLSGIPHLRKLCDWLVSCRLLNKGGSWHRAEIRRRETPWNQPTILSHPSAAKLG